MCISQAGQFLSLFSSKQYLHEETDMLTLFLCGGVMIGRGVDQVPVRNAVAKVYCSWDGGNYSARIHH